MKHLLALLLISGYVALIPVCFFGENHTASASTMSETMGVASAMSIGCPLETAACTADDTSPAAGATSHHTDMYSLLFGFAQTQGSSFLSIIFLAMLPLFFFTAYTFRFFDIPVHIFSYIKKRKEILSLYRTGFLKWLSLSINSPAYAFMM